jgi:hypothetical protein
MRLYSVWLYLVGVAIAALLLSASLASRPTEAALEEKPAAEPPATAKADPDGWGKPGSEGIRIRLVIPSTGGRSPQIAPDTFKAVFEVWNTGDKPISLAIQNATDGQTLVADDWIMGLNILVRKTEDNVPPRLFQRTDDEDRRWSQVKPTFSGEARTIGPSEKVALNIQLRRLHPQAARDGDDLLKLQGDYEIRPVYDVGQRTGLRVWQGMASGGWLRVHIGNSTLEPELPKATPPATNSDGKQTARPEMEPIEPETSVLTREQIRGLDGVLDYDKELANRWDAPAERIPRMSTADLLKYFAASPLRVPLMLYDDPNLGIARAIRVSTTLTEAVNRKDLIEGWMEMNRELMRDFEKRNSQSNGETSSSLLSADQLLLYPPVFKKTRGREKELLRFVSRRYRWMQEVNKSKGKGASVFSASLGSAAQLAVKLAQALEPDGNWKMPTPNDQGEDDFFSRVERLAGAQASSSAEVP